MRKRIADGNACQFSYRGVGSKWGKCNDLDIMFMVPQLEFWFSGECVPDADGLGNAGKDETGCRRQK